MHVPEVLEQQTDWKLKDFVELYHLYIPPADDNGSFVEAIMDIANEKGFKKELIAAVNSA